MIKDSEVTYANQSLSDLLAFKDYLGGVTDIENKVLKKRLETTTIERLQESSANSGGKSVQTTPWQMINKAAPSSSSLSSSEYQEFTEKGGPCKLAAVQQGNSSAGQHEDKYLSMNTVDVNLCGKDSKLFVVRDMTTLVGLQAQNYTK